MIAALAMPWLRRKTMRFDVITLFPDQFRVLSEEGVIARALKRGIAELRLWNPRDFTTDIHRTVDDRPYGGGPGMVMKVEPLLVLFFMCGPFALSRTT